MSLPRALQSRLPIIFLSALGSAGVAAAVLTSTTLGVQAKEAPTPLLTGSLSADSVARADALLARPVPPSTVTETPVQYDPQPDSVVLPVHPAAREVVAPPALSMAPTPGDASLPRARAVGWQADVITSVARAARSAPAAGQVPPSVTVAQAILESDWGRSQLARDANNYFGIKAHGRAGSAGTIVLPTTEVENGRLITVNAPFRAYQSLDDSVADHNRFLLENSRYAAALRVGGNPEAFARGLQQAGYATDPAYAGKLLALMDRYDLYRYDVR